MTYTRSKSASMTSERLGLARNVHFPYILVQNKQTIYKLPMYNLIYLIVAHTESDSPASNVTPE